MHRRATLVVVTIVVALVLATLVELGRDASVTIAQNPTDTPTPIKTATVRITPASTLTPVTAIPIPTMSDPGSGFWDYTSTPPSGTATEPPDF